MFATISFIIGIVLAVTILALTRHQPPDASKPGLLGWSALAFGLISTISLAGAAWQSALGKGTESGMFLLSITLAAAALVVGIGGLQRQDRHWPTWVGLAIGALPALFWVAFTLGNLFILGN